MLLLAARAWAQTPPDPSQIDKVFAAFDKPGSPGCALAVIRDGKIVYKRGYGMADLDHDLPITPASVFHVASISKQFTAASIVLLAEDGKLSLDDTVRKHLPEVPDFGTPVTIRHLLNHTSGMRDQWAFLGLAGWRQNLDLITDGDVMGFVTRQKALNFPPGQMYMYSNTGFTVLAQIVQRVSGKSLREFTSERIFKPLGMTSTHFRDDHAEIVKNMAYGYNQQGNGPFRLSIPNFDTVGATSLLTTVEDLAKWDENFYQDFARRGITAKMLTRGVLNNGEKIDYALGLQHGQYRGLPIVEHGGSLGGYRAHILRFPTQHASVAQRVRAYADNEPWPTVDEMKWNLFKGRAQRISTRPGTFTLTLFPVAWITAHLGIDASAWLWESVRPLDPLPDEYHRKYTNVQAMIALEGLRYLDEWTERTSAHVARMNRALREIEGVKVPSVPTDRTHVYYQYCAYVPDRDALTLACIRRGVDVETLHVDVCTRLGLFGEPRSSPGADRAAQAVQLPVYESLTEAQVDRVAQVVADSLRPRATPSAYRRRFARPRPRSAHATIRDGR